MTQYRVRWTIDVEADSPRDAASKAFDAMQRLGTSANVFDVLEVRRDFGPDAFADSAESIDLSEPEMVAAKDLRPGDVVDLYGDAYADPDKDPGEILEYESTVVEAVKLVSSDWTWVYTGAMNFRCPPNHKVKRLRTDFDIHNQLMELGGA